MGRGATVLFYVLLLKCVLLVCGQNGGIDVREYPGQYFKNLLQVYDKLRRPGPLSEPTIVTLSMYIMKIEEIDLHSESMTLNAFMRYTYVDSRLRHDSVQPIQVSDEETIRQIWEPDIFVENAQESDFHAYPTPNVFMRINPSGEVKFSRRLQLKVHCDENMDSFPMDTITCSLSISTYGSSLETVRLKGLESDGSNKGFGIAADQLPIGYVFKDIKVEEKDSYVSVGSYGVVKVHVVLRRLSGGYVVTIFLPCFLLVLLSYLSLFVDEREAGIKLVFNAVLLGIIVYMSNNIHDIVPRVSRITAMDYYLGTSSFVLTWVMAATIFLEKFSAPGAKLPFFDGQASLWTRRVQLATNFGIPLFYILFHVIFWITYST